MRKRGVTFLAVGLIALGINIVFAQEQPMTQPGREPTPGQRAEEPVQEGQPGQMEERPMIQTQEQAGELTGKGVISPEGRQLGSIREFVTGPEGNISFAILSYGGVLGIGAKRVAVPFSALSYNEERQQFVLDADKEQLEGAPRFQEKEQLADRTFAEEIYRYFGERPYWTERGLQEQPGHMERQTPQVEEEMEQRPGGGSAREQE